MMASECMTAEEFMTTSEAENHNQEVSNHDTQTRNHHILDVFIGTYFVDYQSGERYEVGEAGAGGGCGGTG